METTQLGLRRCFHETHSLLFGLISDAMNPSYSLLLLLHQLLLLLLLLLQLATEPCAFKGLLWGKRWTHKMASNAPPNQHLCRISHHKLNNKAFLGCCKAKFKTVLVVKFSVSKKNVAPKHCKWNWVVGSRGVSQLVPIKQFPRKDLPGACVQAHFRRIAALQ